MNAYFLDEITAFECYTISIELCIEKRRLNMAVSYKKLWKLLIDRDMKKIDLEREAGISHYTINKLNHGENVTTDVLVKICTALNCDIDDIMEIVGK